MIDWLFRLCSLIDLLEGVIGKSLMDIGSVYTLNYALIFSAY